MYLYLYIISITICTWKSKFKFSFQLNYIHYLKEEKKISYLKWASKKNTNSSLVKVV